MSTPSSSQDSAVFPPPGAPNPEGELAIVLGGGAARGAYQAGLLRFIARRYPHLDVPILTGVSAGAINATFLASQPGSFEERVLELNALWERIDVDDVFRVDLFSLLKKVMRWSLQLGVIGGRRGVPNVQGLVDTAPLEKFLEHAYDSPEGELKGIDENLKQGILRAVAVTTTDYRTGETITFYQGRDVTPWDRPMRRAVETDLSTKHVMASAALPVFFPSIAVEGSWFGDGGVRLHSPLAPARHLGASRILAISTRHIDVRGEQANVRRGYPPPAQILGVLFNAVFLDNLDQDAIQMERINHLVSIAGEGAGPMRKIALEVLRPSQDLGIVAAAFEPAMPRALRFLTRRLGTREQRSQSLMSMLMFQSDYLSRLMDLGEADGARQVDEIARVIEGP